MSITVNPNPFPWRSLFVTGTGIALSLTGLYWLAVDMSHTTRPLPTAVDQAIETCERTGGEIRVVRYTHEKGLELNCIYGDELYYDEATDTLVQPV